MRNSVLVFILCVLLFAAGYGTAVLVGLQNKVDDGLFTVGKSTTRIINNSYGAPIYIIKEVEVEAEPYSYEQENLFQDIKRSFYTDAAQLVVDGIPMSDLVPLVSRISGFEEDNIWRMQQPHTFAKNLIALGLQECQDIYDAGDEIPNVLFSLDVYSPAKSTSSSEEETATVAGVVFTNEFKTVNATRIYANFELPNSYEYGDVLVKWCRAAPNRNIIYGPHSIDITRKSNYVWYETLNPQAGIYFVTIYSSDQEPKLLATSSYLLVDE